MSGKKTKGKKNGNKNKITFLEIYQGIRRLWARNPSTQVVPNKKRKSRTKTKQDFKRQLKNEGY